MVPTSAFTTTKEKLHWTFVKIPRLLPWFSNLQEMHRGGWPAKQALVSSRAQKRTGRARGHLMREVLSRAPFIVAPILLTSAGYEVGKFASTLCHFASSIISHTGWGFCWQERWFRYNFCNGAKLRPVGLANGSSHGRIGLCHSSWECLQVIGP